MAIRWHTVAAALLVAMLLPAAPSRARQIGVKPPAASPQPVATPPQPVTDKLGRDTPRGTLLGFLDAMRKGNKEVAPMYLDTKLRDEAAIEQARQLYVVIDNRLPSRLNQLSDQPEGSLINPLKPDQDIIGTIQTVDGPVELVVERVKRGATGPIWLFSRKTLEAVPYLFDEIDLVSVDEYLPEFLTKPRLGGVRLFGWLSLVLVVPLGYRFFGLVSALVRPVSVVAHRRFGWDDWPDDLLPGPLRLLVLTISIRWIVSQLELPLRERQFWTAVEAVLATVAIVWLLLRLNASVERYIRRRLDSTTAGEMAAMLRLARRATDVVILAASLLVMLHFFGFNPSAALAGLGIGGIAVALAAQKTLENVVGGLSIVFDKAVRVGDTLKIGEIVGTVDYVGLRSTRIRTLDRTIVSVPNGQIANVNIEVLSVRDMFWFHHFLGLRYDTTSSQMRAVVEGVRGLLASFPGADPSTVRVRFIRLGQFSLDIELFAYILATDWAHFLEIQQDLLLRIMEVVEHEGTAIALPSQTLTLADARSTAALPATLDEARSTPALPR